MKSNKPHTLWIIIASLASTAYTCSKAIVKASLKTITPAWCDAELQRWIHRLLQLIKVQCTIINPHHIRLKQGHPTIIMCNHTSLYDIPLSFYAFPHASVRMLAKKELFKVPFLGKAMKAAGFPMIDRHNRRQAIQQMEGLTELLQSGIVLWLAPEGTRSKDGKLGPFKKGGFITAINTGATIIPIGIRGANSILPARTHQLNLGQQVEIHVGEPVDATEYTLEEKDLLIEKVHGIMKGLVEPIS